MINVNNHTKTELQKITEQLETELSFTKRQLKEYKQLYKMQKHKTKEQTLYKHNKKRKWEEN